MEFRTKFERKLVPLEYRGEQVTWDGEKLFLRTLSAAEYLKFCEASDNVSLVMLAVCESAGHAVWTESDRAWLSGGEVDGGLLQSAVKNALAHCFGEGIETRQEELAGNS